MLAPPTLNVRFPAAVLLVVLLGTGSAGVLHPACGQDAAGPDTTAQTTTDAPTPHGRWGVGGQFFPLLGLSGRMALTRRFSVQVGGTPLPGKEFPVGNIHAMVGGRALYKVVVESWYNVFAGVSTSAVFRESVESRRRGEEGSKQVRANRVEWFGSVTGGIEVLLWSRFGVSAEVGLSEDWGDPSFHVQTFIGGVGLHFYW